MRHSRVTAKATHSCSGVLVTISTKLTLIIYRNKLTRIVFISMAVNTTNYKFNKPVVGADTDSWGDELNENWDKVDSLLYGASYTDDDSNTVERIQPDLDSLTQIH